MSLAKVLLCLDTDQQPSVFDGVVAVDAGVDQLFRHGGVTAPAVRELVYGAMFTRGPDELHNTAVFIGGSDVTAGERILKEVTDTFFGPMRVSVMLDSNGSNTTAAAAAIAAGRHVDLATATVTVLAGTGSVGKRVVRLLAQEGAHVRVGSRSQDHGQQVADEVRAQVPGANIACYVTVNPDGLRESLAGANVVIASGPPEVQLLPRHLRSEFPALRVAIDLNAVPPLGIEGNEVTDKAADQEGTICYGAIGVGGTKMKVHRAAIARLFTANNLVLDAPQIYALGQELESGDH